MSSNPHNYRSSDFFPGSGSLFCSYYLIWIEGHQSYRLSHELIVESYCQFGEFIEDCGQLNLIIFRHFNCTKSSSCIIWSYFKEF